MVYESLQIDDLICRGTQPEVCGATQKMIYPQNGPKRRIWGQQVVQRLRNVDPHSEKRQYVGSTANYQLERLRGGSPSCERVVIFDPITPVTLRAHDKVEVCFLTERHRRHSQHYATP